MRLKLLLILMLGVLSLGATTYKVRGGFEYEADLKIYSYQEINRLKPGIVEYQENNKRPTYYLYGWIRLKNWPTNPSTIIPRCDVKAWNKYFDVSLALTDLNENKSEILIPLGSTVNDKDFNLKIK